MEIYWEDKFIFISFKQENWDLIAQQETHESCPQLEAWAYHLLILLRIRCE